MKAVIVNDMIGLITGVDEDGDAVVEFGGSYQLQISKVDNEWKVTNGVNGYGNNCQKEFEDATVIPLYESTAPDGWVSVEDGLPGCGMYNVSYYNPSSKHKQLYVITIWRGRNGWYYDNYEKEPAEDNTLKVTHWMPLPQPPKQ